MSKNNRVGWQQRCGKSFQHFYVGELPICGTRVIKNLHPKTKPISQVPFCKRCIMSLQSAIDKVH